jgi:3-oxoacyl-[acyl-carrier protein] reductase
MDLGLRGRSAAVAAASRGLGRAAALALAAEGADVAICARGEEGLHDAEHELAALGVRTLAVPLDLADAEAPAQFVEAAAATFGRLDVLVTNSPPPPPGGVDGFTDEQYRGALEANLMSVVRMALAAVPHMRKQRWGRIVCIQSNSVKQPLDHLVLSNTARAGGQGFAKTLANEVAADGITVNTVCPGLTLTDRVYGLAEAAAARTGTTLDVALERFEKGNPMGRLGRPEEVGALCAFLASERAAFVTGTAILIDGGAYPGLL